MDTYSSASSSSADFHRPQRTPSINSSTTTTTTSATVPTSELLICFTSRLSSSSSMKLTSSSSKSSILSPARSRDPPPQISLSSSLSRRLRTNGSLKGGQASPMFPPSASVGKKRGGPGFDNPEPSSPKVTCIGQVRVKTKKQGKKLRTRSQRKGEVSFRKLELSRSGHHSFPPNGNPECLPHRNQRWVHFPVTICEALRTFGGDWNCFLPCRSSCMSSKEDKGVGASSGSDGGGGNDGSSCGAVIARWLVAVHEGEGRGRREIELVVGGEEIPSEVKERSRSQRRHVFEGLEFNEEEISRERKEAEEEEEQGRVSICIPPKNALLLMRCRSDPVKMAALANRFCESPTHKVEEDDTKAFEDFQEDVNGSEKAVEEEMEQEIEDSNEELSEDCWVTAEASEAQRAVDAESSFAVTEEDDGDADEEEEEVDLEIFGELQEISADKSEEIEDKEEERSGEVLNTSPAEVEIHREREEETSAATIATFLVDIDEEVDFSNELSSTQSKMESDTEEPEWREMDAVVAEKVAPELEETVQEMAGEGSTEPENPEPDDDNGQVAEAEGGDGDSKGRDSVDCRDPSVLPDCLLLMMCEPKLSMEVSKETWVCSTDFIRWLPERHVTKASGGVDDTKKGTGPDTKRSGSALTAQQARILQQPPRSSCSFPSQAEAARAARRGGESMATAIEQKLLNVKSGEPLVLTRCKSEPMRTAAVKLAPDSCFWKNRKLEPHRPSANLRVKAAGVGF